MKSKLDKWEVATSELEQRVNKRMEPIEQQIRADHQQALSQMREIEKGGPGAVKRLNQLVAEIELRRAEDRLEHLEKLLIVLADTTTEVKEALADVASKNFQAGRAKAEKVLSERLDLMLIRMYGKEKWMKNKVEGLVREHYTDLEARYSELRGGNGHGD